MTAQTLTQIDRLTHKWEDALIRRGFPATMTLAETSEALRLSYDYMRRLVKDGQIEYTRAGKKYLFMREHVARYLALGSSELKG